MKKQMNIYISILTMIVFFGLFLVTDYLPLKYLNLGAACFMAGALIGIAIAKR